MWWPITGKVSPTGAAADTRGAIIDTGRFQFRAVPADIEVLNRRAKDGGDYDVTAISFRTYCDVKDRYALTACGSSFGDGFGPKLVRKKTEERCDANSDAALEWLRSCRRIAIPGRGTTAFLLFGMAVGADMARDASRFIERPFEAIIPEVVAGHVDAGIVIHEGQVLFEQAGLESVLDVGAWWKRKTGLPLPLGANVIRRGLEREHGAGTLADIERTLRASIRYALAHRDESLQYTLPFALTNASRSGHAAGEPPTLDRVDDYITMYVNRFSESMGQAGREAARRLFRAGLEAGLCPDPGELDVVGL